VVLSLGASRIWSSMLFQVRPTDPITFLGATVLLVFVAFIASLVPAVSATRVDPMAGLRME